MDYKIDRSKETQIDITIPWGDVKVEFEKMIDDAIKNVSVKGFRKGSVPREIAKSKIDKTKLLSEVADKMIRKYYVEIIEKEELKTVGAPRVTVIKLAQGNDIEIRIDTAVIPSVEIQKDWKTIIKKINAESKNEKIKITDEQVQKELEQIANSRAQYKEVDRKTKKGDHIKIDFTVKQDGVIIENGKSENHSLILGSGVFIPGFEEQIIGMQKGEEKTFKLEFPKEYQAKHLAGKEAEFDVMVRSVEEQILPEINNTFAKSLGSKFKTLDDLKKSIKDGMEKEAINKNNEKKRTKYLDTLVDLVEIDLPQIILDDEMQRMIGEFEQQLSMSGMKFNEYLKKIGKTREDLEKEWKPQAKKRVMSALILEQIADNEKIDIDSKEVEQEMNKTLQMYKGVEDVEKNINMEQLYEYTKGVIRNNKVFDILEKL